MAKVSVLNLNGEKLKDLTLNDEVWNIEVNNTVLHDAIVLALASLRQGTHCTKNRAEVSGGGRKPWRQKGTGRARSGSSRSPIWVGGGITFGPKPRDYSKKQNKKERRLALRSALSYKFQNGELIVVDSLNLESNKTSNMVSTLKTLNSEVKTLFVSLESIENLDLATRNLPKVGALTVDSINVLELTNVDKLIIEEAAVKKLEEVLG